MILIFSLCRLFFFAIGNLFGNFADSKCVRAYLARRNINLI